MKTYFHAFAMCQSMFCAIPFPGKIWDEGAKGRMLLFLPIIGLEIGGIWTLLAWLCRYLNLPTPVTALVLCVWPFFSTGFIHLDGFMDVTDAVKSWRSLERRREILKDSHVGSFAVIAIVMLILAQFAFFAAAKQETNILILLLIPAVSRCGSALAVSGLRSMSTSQYSGQEKPKAHLLMIGGMLAVLLALGFLTCGKYGFALLGCMAGYGLALRRGYKSLQGMNGDIAGYALTVGEMCAVAVYALI